MMMHKALLPRNGNDRFYMLRKERGGGALTNIDDCIEAKIQGCEEYTKKSKDSSQ